MSTRSLLSPRILPGLLIVLAGLLLLLHNLDLFEIGSLWRFWPLVLVAFGIQLALDAADRPLGIVLIVVGAALQLRLLGLLYLDWELIWRFWPLLLIFVGVGLMVRRTGRDNVVGGVVLVTLGAYFLGENFGVFRFDLWDLWPVAVIALGIVMVRKALGR